MANNFGDIAVKITADADQFNSSLSKAGSALGGFKSLLGSLGVAVSVGGFAAMIKASIDMADHLHDVSQRTGISVERLAGLRIVAEQSGTSLEDLGTALKKLSVNQVAANSGNKEMASIFRQLGIAGTDSQEALYRLADIFSTLPDGAEKTALAVKLLGKNGANMIPLFNEGGDKIKHMADEGQKLANVTTTMAGQADKFNDQMVLLKAQSGALGVVMANQMLPALNDISAAMLQAAKDGGILKAAWVALGGLGAAAFTDEFASAEIKIRNLKSDLAELVEKKSSVQDGGYLQKWLYGSTADIDKKIQSTLERIDSLQKSLIKQPEKTKPKPAVDVKKVLGTSGNSEGNSFIENLQRQIAKIGLGEYAMLRLEAAQKGVAKSAEPYIRQLKRASEAHQLLIDKQEAQMRNDERLFAREIKDIFGDPKAIDDYLRGLDRIRDDLAFQQSMLGATKDEVEALTQARQIQLGVEDQIRQAEQDGMVMSEENQQRLREGAKKSTDEIIAQIEKRKKADSDWTSGIKKGMADYSDSIGSMADRVAGLYTRAFGKMEDALVDFVMHGKLSFHDLAQSIIADIVRIQVQEQVTNPLSKAVGNIFSSIFGDTSVPSFDVGTNYVPRDMLAMVHKGEAIVPAKYNNGGTGAQSVRVELVNQGQPQQVVSAQPSFDMDGMVLKIVTRDLARGGDLAGAMEQKYGLNPAAGAYR